MRWNLRARATLLGTALFAALLVAGSFLLVATLEARLTDATDQLTRSRAEDLLQLARAGDLPKVLTNLSDNGMAQVVSSDGRVLAASPNIAGRPAVAQFDAGSEPRHATFEAPDDSEIETYRVWYASGPTPDGEVTVYVGDSLESVAEATVALRKALAVGLPFVVVALGGVIWVLIGRSLGRLDLIRAEVDRISEENLDARVADAGRKDEVGRLAGTMNAMLTRLQVAAQRQRDFVADVSHDLQSPLAAQRVALELALADPDGVDTGQLRSEVLGATTQMEHLVQDLLVLAAVDAGSPARPRLMDLDALVLEEATRARAGAGVRIDTKGVSAAPAHADPDDVRRIVRNLMDNAVAHARSQVVLAVDVHGGWATADIVDDGPGIPADERDRIFDRFRRGDTARSAGSGSGLGLAIARGLAERGGGRVDLLDSPGGAHLRLVLPIAPSEAGH